MTPRGTIWAILKEFGCQPTIGDDENEINFEYQGRDFIINAYDDNCWINIAYPWCIQFPLEEIADLYAFKESINNANFHGVTTVLYGINDEHDLFGVHLRYSWPMHNTGDPGNKEVMAAILSTFFKERNSIFDYLCKLNNERKKKKTIELHVDKTDSSPDNKNQ